MNKMIRWGILGTGRIARAFAEGLKNTSNGFLNAVGSRSQDSAQNFANEHKLVEVKYYGWRLVIFDEFRNAVSIKETTLDKGQSYSILAYVLYAFLLITLFFGIQFIRGWFDSEN